MTNEELIALNDGFNDDAVFSRECLKINDKLGRKIRLDYGPAQVKLAALIAKLRAQRKPVRVIVLKARQVYISTYIASRFWRDTTHNPGQHTLVLAQDDDTAGNIFSVPDLRRKLCSLSRLLQETRTRRYIRPILKYANGSYIKFHTANTPTVGRSRSLRRVHFSEFAFYLKAAELMRAVMSSVPDDADTEVLVESTANGLGNEFHLMWQRAVSGESEWVPFFFAWWEHPDQPRDRRAPGLRGFTLAREKLLRQNYNLTDEQLNWRRWKISTDLGGDESSFRREYPSFQRKRFFRRAVRASITKRWRECRSSATRWKAAWS